MSTHSLRAPELAQIQVHGTTRGAFLVRATLAAGAVVGASSVSPFVSKALAQSGGGDIDVLNYALTLEYLEGAYYQQGVKQTQGLSSDIKKLATELRDNELEHVDALKAAIKGAGGKPVDKPEVDFGGSFASEATFLKTANTFEDTGVSAYNGAAPMIQSPDVLGAAGSIVQVEARHAALIRLARNKPPSPLAFDKPSTMDEVVSAVTPFLKA